MKASALIFSTLSLIFSSNLSATENPKSLREAIAVAVKYNPKTISTNELLESIHYSTLATKTDMYPRVSVNCSGSYSGGNTNFNGLPSAPSKGASGDCGVSLNVNLYDGKSSYYGYKAAEASEAATAAAYNTSDSLIPNTRGGLANQAVNIFVSLANSNGAIEHSKKSLSYLKIFEKISDDYNLKSTITETEQDIEQMNDSLKLQKESFEYTVTVPPSDDLDDLDTTIGTLKIPASADDAINLALSNGPEVIRRNLNVQMAEFNLKSIKGSLGPSITLSVNAGKSIYSDKVSSANNYNSNSNSVGVMVSIPIGGGGHYRKKSSEAALAASKSEREAAIADAKHSISEQYKKLINLRNNYLSNSKNYTDQLNYLQSLAESVDQGRTLTVDITKVLTAINTLEKRYYQLQRTQDEILTALFGIQQVTGQLFNEFALI
ncbi:MAG: TolC family protein [Bacteriovorax sp.]|nr:TolC family protein [Bacteriovorax sp.]